MRVDRVQGDADSHTGASESERQTGNKGRDGDELAGCSGVARMHHRDM